MKARKEEIKDVLMDYAAFEEIPLTALREVNEDELFEIVSQTLSLSLSYDELREALRELE